jgi:putative phosphoesterase
MTKALRIGLISDTHGSAAAYAAALDALGQVDLILHAGDFAHDALVIAKRTGITTHAVLGNCDFGPGEEEAEFVLRGHRLLLLHGHHHGVKRSLERLAAYAHEKQANICVFGHSHTALIKRVGECLFINPGSPLSPRVGGPSCALLELEAQTAPRAEILACAPLR